MNILSKTFFKTSLVLRRLGQRLSEDKEWIATLKKWKKLDREKSYRTNYPDLNEQSIVFDLGGYRGQWASDIYAQYLAKVYVFEPHPVYAKNIKKRFHKNKNVQAFDYGLGAKDEQMMLSTDEESSSVFAKGKNQVAIQIKTAATFIQEHQIDKIDLMKINIEGGEYQLLDHLITTGLITKIKDIQIQFHHFVPNAESLMADLHKRLAETHETTYFYKFFWENWTLKK